MTKATLVHTPLHYTIIKKKKIFTQSLTNPVLLKKKKIKNKKRKREQSGDHFT
jgi:hypothetical protein